MAEQEYYDADAGGESGEVRKKGCEVKFGKLTEEQKNMILEVIGRHEHYLQHHLTTWGLLIYWSITFVSKESNPYIDRHSSVSVNCSDWG